MGPTAVFDQSMARMRSPISPPPARNSSACGGGLLGNVADTAIQPWGGALGGALTTDADPGATSCETMLGDAPSSCHRVQPERASGEAGVRIRSMLRVLLDQALHALHIHRSGAVPVTAGAPAESP